MEVPKKVENKKEEKAYVRLGKLQSLLMCWQRGAALRQKGETARGGAQSQSHKHQTLSFNLCCCILFPAKGLEAKGGKARGRHNHTNIKLFSLFSGNM